MRIFTDRMYREGRTIETMVSLYCKHHHGKRVKDCESCGPLEKYALDRLYHCPFQEAKTTCKNCPVHCYKPSMKEDVRVVMRFAGPRMLLRHPILTIYHFIDDRRKEPLIHLGSQASESCPGPNETQDSP
jgi:hypothetical protein